LASAANVTFVAGLSFDEITPSLIVRFAASTFNAADARFSRSCRSRSDARHSAPPCNCVVSPLFQPGAGGVMSESPQITRCVSDR
jgi:hypothetical protein